MRKINIKSLNAILLMEDNEEHEEKDRRKIYDKNGVYLDYFVCDDGDTDDITKYCMWLEEIKDIDELADYFGWSCEITKSIEEMWDSMVEYDFGYDYQDDEVDEMKENFFKKYKINPVEVLINYGINEIGDYFIRIWE